MAAVNLLVIPSGGTPQKLAATDTATLAKLAVTGTVDFTGASLTGVATTGIADATGSVNLDGSGNLTETALVSVDLTPSGAMTLRGGGASKFGDDTSYWNFDGSGAASSSGMTTVDLDCSGALQINSSGGAVSIANDAVNQAVNIATGGTRTVTIGSANATLAVNGSGGDGTVTVKDNSTAALTISGSDATARVAIRTTNNTEALELPAAALHLGSVSGTYPITQAGTASAALAIGDIVSIDGTAAKVAGADANSGTANLRDPVGVATLASSGDGDPIRYAIGGIVTATFDASIATSDIGKRCYLSATAKQATLTPPSGTGTAVWLLGKVVGAAGSTSAQILWHPQFLLDIP
jgi:hypothetical protein